MKEGAGTRVRDFMIPKPVVFATDTDLLYAARVLIERRISGAPVVDDQGTLVGVLTERDLLRSAVLAGYHDEGAGRVGDYMTTDIEVADIDDTLFDVAKRFIEGKYRRFPVVEGHRVVGLVTRRDLLRVILGDET